MSEIDSFVSDGDFAALTLMVATVRPDLTWYFLRDLAGYLAGASVALRQGEEDGTQNENAQILLKA